MSGCPAPPRKQSLLSLLAVARMTNLQWHSIDEHLLAGTPADWRQHGYVRVWEATPIRCRRGPTPGRRNWS